MKDNSSRRRTPCRANKYSFAPTVGEFKGVRTFGQQVKHLAATNCMLAAGALGERPPDNAGDETGPEDLRMKGEILDYLRGSFRALHRAAAAIDDANAVVGDVPISPLTGQATRLGYVLEALRHIYEHYGQMVSTFASTASSHLRAAIDDRAARMMRDLRSRAIGVGSRGPVQIDHGRGGKALSNGSYRVAA